MNLDGLMLTKQKFSKMVESEVIATRSNYIDAILSLCEKHGIDPEDMKKYVSPVILSKLTVEARKNNLLKVKNNKKELTFE